jgi:hypothetical protein
MRAPLTIQKALTALLKPLPFLLLPITGMLTGFLPVQDFCSTMSLLSGRTTL